MGNYFIYLLLVYGMFAILFLINLAAPILRHRRISQQINAQQQGVSSESAP